MTCGSGVLSGWGWRSPSLGAGSAQAADELSVTQRLEDRREVAAGTRAQVLGFQDGRFYANGWHTTGEMGGIVTPPLKLLDSVSFGVDGEWVGPATRFTSGWGYARYDLPATQGVELRRIDVAPDGRRGALLGLELTNPSGQGRTVDRDGRRALRADDAVPVGLRRDGAERERQRARHRRVSTAARSCSATRAGSRARTTDHSYTAIVGSDRRAVGRRDRPRPLRAVRRRARVPDGGPARADAERVRRRPVRPRHRRAAALPRASWAGTTPRRCGSPSRARRTRPARRARSSRA